MRILVFQTMDFQSIVVDGIAPTGIEITWLGLRCFRIADGKIAEGWSQFDQLGIMQQLGVIPASTQAPELQEKEPC